MSLSIIIVLQITLVSLLSLLALLIASSQLHNWPGRLMVMLCVTLSAMMLGNMPEEFVASETAAFAFRLLDVPTTILAWLFVRSLLDRDFKMLPLYWVLAFSFCLPLLVYRLDSQGITDILGEPLLNAVNIYTLGLFSNLTFDVLKGLRDDLLEPRRKLRFFFVFTIVVLTIVSTASEFVLVGDTRYLRVPFKALVFLPLVFATFFWIFRVRSNHFAFPAPVTATKHMKDELALTYKEQSLRKRLQAEMDMQKVWMQPDLTIKTLAARLGTTQHTLRALINQRLGFDNFSAFINRYRIEAIKSELADPNRSDTTILEIALKNGFNSVSPFNQAFKAIEGMAPSEYRSKASKETDRL